MRKLASLVLGCADLEAEVYCSKCEWEAHTYDEHPGFFCREVNFT